MPLPLHLHMSHDHISISFHALWPLRMNSVINVLRINHSYKSVHRQPSQGHRRHSLFCLTQASFAGTRRHLFLYASLLTPIYTVCWVRPITWSKRFSLCHTTTSLPSDLWVSHAICIAKRNQETALNNSKHIGIEVNARKTKAVRMQSSGV